MGFFDELEDDLQVDYSGAVSEKISEIVEEQFAQYYPCLYNTDLHCIPLSKVKKLQQSEIKDKKIILYCYSKEVKEKYDEEDIKNILYAIDLCKEFLTIWTFKAAFKIEPQIPDKLYEDKGSYLRATDKHRDKTTSKAIDWFYSEGELNDYDLVIDVNK